MGRCKAHVFVSKQKLLKILIWYIYIIKILSMFFLSLYPFYLSILLPYTLIPSFCPLSLSFEGLWQPYYNPYHKSVNPAVSWVHEGDGRHQQRTQCGCHIRCVHWAGLFLRFKCKLKFHTDLPLPWDDQKYMTGIILWDKMWEYLSKI